MLFTYVNEPIFDDYLCSNKPQPAELGFDEIRDEQQQMQQFLPASYYAQTLTLHILKDILKVKGYYLLLGNI